jgi:hypothetical protein
VSVGPGDEDRSRDEREHDEDRGRELWAALEAERARQAELYRQASADARGRDRSLPPETPLLLESASDPNQMALAVALRAFVPVCRAGLIAVQASLRGVALDPSLLVARAKLAADAVETAWAAIPAGPVGFDRAPWIEPAMRLFRLIVEELGFTEAAENVNVNLAALEELLAIVPVPATPTPVSDAPPGEDRPGLDDQAVALFTHWHREQREGRRGTISLTALAATLGVHRRTLYRQELCPLFVSLWGPYREKEKPSSKGRRKGRPERKD